jgi:hypothetical protein
LGGGNGGSPAPTRLNSVPGPPELAAELYERSPGPKDMVWLDVKQHIDF